MSTQAVLVGAAERAQVPCLGWKQSNSTHCSPPPPCEGPSLKQTWEERETWVSAKESFAGMQTLFPGVGDVKSALFN